MKKLAKIAVAALEDIKAKDITVLDVKKLTPLFDTMIVATGDSNRQVRALADHAQEQVKAAGFAVLATEGEEGGEWIVVDCIDVVIHVMQPDTRVHYNLEELWTPPSATRRKRVMLDAAQTA